VTVVRIAGVTVAGMWHGVAVCGRPWRLDSGGPAGM